MTFSQNSKPLPRLFCWFFHWTSYSYPSHPAFCPESAICAHHPTILTFTKRPKGAKAEFHKTDNRISIWRQKVYNGIGWKANQGEGIFKEGKDLLGIGNAGQPHLRARRRSLMCRIHFASWAGALHTSTVQPKAGRSENIYWLGKVSLLHPPSSLGLDGGCMQCTRPGGKMNPAHKASSFRFHIRLPSHCQVS